MCFHYFFIWSLEISFNFVILTKKNYREQCKTILELKTKNNDLKNRLSEEVDFEENVVVFERNIKRIINEYIIKERQ